MSGSTMNKHPCAAATAVNVSIASDDSEQRRIFHKKHYTTGVLSRGGGYSHILPIRVCAAQRGRDFEAPDLERGIHFRGVF